MHTAAQDASNTRRLVKMTEAFTNQVFPHSV